MDDTTLIDWLKPKWKPNEILEMFHEERSKIEQRGKECKNLFNETESALKQVVELRDLYLYVSPKTSQLHSECKSIIQERNDLRDSYEKINFRLSKQEELRGIFKRMPEIKNQICSILNSICNNYQTRAKESGDSIPLDEYYGKFFVECRRIKELTAQLELCFTSANTSELSIYIEEIYRLYFDVREQLVEPEFARTLEKLIGKADRNFCDLLQHSCASLVRIIRDEMQLFNQIFSAPPQAAGQTATTAITSSSDIHSSLSAMSNTQQGEPSNPFKKQTMDEFIEMLCKTFYDHLRPVIIHVNHLETLTELYKLVNETMRQEIEDTHFQSTMNNLAEDIQERMVFRTEVFIKDSILDYKPSSGDLAYPEKFDLVPGGDLKDYQSMWYPTVQRTVLALLYLNRIFDSLTFRELAHELVLACYSSLDVAQRLVDERHGESKIEASIFLSKHLAIIIDQLQLYGIDQDSLRPPSPLFATAAANESVVCQSVATIERRRQQKEVQTTTQSRQEQQSLPPQQKSDTAVAVAEAQNHEGNANAALSPAQRPIL